MSITDHSGHMPEGLTITNISNDESRFWSVVEDLLPEQGCIEVQRDRAGKEHSWHRHDVDETLVILEGEVQFYWEGGEQRCGPGAVISLPAGTSHGSVALEPGATYLISFHKVDLSTHG